MHTALSCAILLTHIHICLHVFCCNSAMLAEAVHSVVDIANQVTRMQMFSQLIQPAHSAATLLSSFALAAIAFRG